MRTDDLESLLRSEPLLEPSAGFTAAVMARVLAEAEAPAPLEVPWRRVAPALVLAGACVIAAGVAFGSAMASAPDTPPGAGEGLVARAIEAFLGGGGLAYLVVLVTVLGTMLVVWCVSPNSRTSL